MQNGNNLHGQVTTKGDRFSKNWENLAGASQKEMDEVCEG